MHGIRNVKMQDDILEKIVVFLAQLIAGEKEDLADNIMFFHVYSEIMKMFFLPSMQEILWIFLCRALKKRM